jgi:peptide/nickel transport system substrate-binding protein
MNMITNPALASRYAQAFTNVKGYSDVKDGGATSVSGITAPDANTVVIQLEQLDAGLLVQIPDLDILPKHVIGSTAPAQVCQSQFWIDDSQRIGAGPYKWSQRVDDQRIELEAFSDYFLGAPKIAKVNLLLFSSYETSLAAFAQQSNYASPLTVDNLDYAKGLEYGDVSTQSSGVLILEVNAYSKDVPLLSDKRVRQAISFAIDRKTIAEQLYKNVSAVPTYWTTPWLEWSKSPDLETYDFNVDKAKSLMKDAGWSSDKELTLWYYYTDQVTASVVEAIAQYLSAIGINAKPRLDSGGAMAAAQKAGTWEIVYGAWGLSPALNMSQPWNCDTTLKYCNTDFEKLMTEARSTLDQTKQQDLLKQAVKILNDDLPSIWLFNRQNIVVQNKKLDTAGHQAWATGSLMYHNYIEQWTVKS